MIIVFVPLVFLFCRHISKSKLIYDPKLQKRKYLIISFNNRNWKYVYRKPREDVKKGEQCE